MSLYRLAGRDLTAPERLAVRAVRLLVEAEGAQAGCRHGGRCPRSLRLQGESDECKRELAGKGDPRELAARDRLIAWAWENLRAIDRDSREAERLEMERSAELRRASLTTHEPPTAA